MRWRFAVALGLSLLFHAWLMQDHYRSGAARRGIEEAHIAAQLLPPVAVNGISAPLLTISDSAAAPVPERHGAGFQAAPNASAAPPSATAAAAVTTTSAAVPPPPSDPTYYAVGDLDVFPAALVKPDLNAALAAHPEPAAGQVRATLLIDEAGVVNAVRGVEAPAADMAAAARDLLLRTRFTPARNKEGRIVKAQLLVALDYDLRGAPAAR
jgi:hypothetical protein